MQKISEAEMELMEIIWNHENPMTSKEIMEFIPENQWKPTTVLTLLSRLMEKGFLAAERKGRSHQYSWVVSEEEYKRQCGKSFLQKFYEGSAKNFFAALCDDGELNEKDLEELREILRKKED